MRDPRNKLKAVAKPATAVTTQQRRDPDGGSNVAPLQQRRPPPMPFEPSAQNQHSVGSSLASYALAGIGVTLGVVLVRVVLGF